MDKHSYNPLHVDIYVEWQEFNTVPPLHIEKFNDIDSALIRVKELSHEPSVDYIRLLSITDRRRKGQK